MKDTENLAASFSQKLKQLRQSKGWSQGQLGKKIGTNLQCISKYELGQSWPTAKTLVQIASIFDVSLDYLLRNDTPAPASKIRNPDLLKRLEKFDQLSGEDQKTLISVMDAFFRKHRFEEASQWSFQ